MRDDWDRRSLSAWHRLSAGLETMGWGPMDCDATNGLRVRCTLTNTAGTNLSIEDNMLVAKAVIEFVSRSHDSLGRTSSPVADPYHHEAQIVCKSPLSVHGMCWREHSLTECNVSFNFRQHRAVPIGLELPGCKGVIFDDDSCWPCGLE